MNTEIIQWATNDKSFEQGLILYMRLGLNMAFKHVLNRQGQNTATSSVLKEQLGILSGMNSIAFQLLLDKPLIKKENPSNSVAPLKIEEADNVSYPVVLVKSIKLREEFPFLKENNCPDELKILVTDMLSTYDNYFNSHPQLFQASSMAELLKTEQFTVMNFLANREIWDEMNYYKINGKILGKHPIFKKNDLDKVISRLSVNELHAKRSNLINGINRINLQLKSKDQSHLRLERMDKLSLKTIELALVNKYLNL